MSETPTAENLEYYVSGLLAGFLLAFIMWLLFSESSGSRSSGRPVKVYRVDPSDLELDG